ncbi:protection of telomeres protein 1a-like isoform X1 [Ananas comosus]|uniref:Protection of telomeres protein 1a-like isoform X1 n=1 Tax=Ananas comosus TaxID=4615 RepID=A0A6P5GLJ7_ANACO|nr:protection of telomeres protein 1a-like isoform X1 [Ananas comosus]
MATREREHVYLPLKDALECVGVKINLFAVVAEIGAIIRSRGTDYVLTLKIVDQSLPILGISVNFFGDDATRLPHVKANGDIICLHNVMMKAYNGNHYCLYNKRFSSFALFEGITSIGINPYEISSKYCRSDGDSALLLELRRWSIDHLPTAALKESTLQLRSVKVGVVFDLVCKVLHVCETSNGGRILFVWDGTDAPPLQFQGNLDNGLDQDPLHLEELPLSREVLCSFPPVGTVLRVFSNKVFKEFSHLQESQHWVRLCNMNCEVLSGVWKGILGPSSKVRLLSNVDDSVLDSLMNYDERMMSSAKRVPLTCFPAPSHILEVNHENAVYSTLMDSLTHNEIVHRSKCIVRVVAACPWHVEHLRSPVTGRYRVKVTLEDPTARIHAYIVREDAARFFGASPEQDLAHNMNALLGIAEGASGEGGNSTYRDPPWVWCCLRSYYLEESDPWGTRRYRICDTELVG